ncbi:hypothetical protein ART_0506 [Arthrobacter sp. PAMC 25486]|uniref:hypothetical protein n=1 Tax=Arthrobacter sp. PAMC 25486 TaxID=1494608 RepID=UPI0005360D43|nr:hypothetical protein [Arthrobacter sp. PAMC 25486]AIY00105.1 hypothetical protein ART_0506 [Arthrobacter sp. PAMC 25486]
MIRSAALKEGLADTSTPSHLFIHYNQRVIEGTVGSDADAQIQNGIKSVAGSGVCDETLWPYDITRFAVHPPPSCFAAAKDPRAVTYSRVGQSLSQLKGCLASGYPAVSASPCTAASKASRLPAPSPCPEPAKQFWAGTAW